MKIRVLILLLSLSACTTNQPIDGTAIDDMNVELHQGINGNTSLERASGNRAPSEISTALLPDLKIRRPNPNQANKRFDIAVKDVPAKVFYMGLVEDTTINLAVSPEIKGNVSLSLKQVTVEQVLQTLEKLYGYAYNPIPGGYEVLPNTLSTRIYPVNYLDLERKSRSKMKLSSGEVTQTGSGQGGGGGGNSGGSSGGFGGGFGSGFGGGGNNNGNNVVEAIVGEVETKATIDFWKKLKSSLETLVGTEGGRSIMTNPIAGVVVIKAYPKELKQVEQYLDLVQNSMDRQVVIEAKILEVTLSNDFQMGINWKLFGLELNAIHAFPTTDLSLNDFPDAFTATIKWNPTDFTTTIRALEEQGNVQVLSSPHISTMNNQMAAIKVGQDEFFVTNVSSTQNVGTLGAATNPTQDLNLTPFFSGITLDVTPQIDSQDNVTLHIHPTISLVKDQRKRIDLGNQVGTIELPLAQSTIRESDTIVHARNGQVVVLGGLMQNTTDEDIAQPPLLGNIPFAGALFRATKQQSRKTELVILLKPMIMNAKTINQKLAESTDRIASLKRGFHLGGRPDIYGTEGELPVTFGPASGQYQQARR